MANLNTPCYVLKLSFPSFRSYKKILHQAVQTSKFMYLLNRYSSSPKLLCVMCRAQSCEHTCPRKVIDTLFITKTCANFHQITLNLLPNSEYVKKVRYARRNFMLSLPTFYSIKMHFKEISFTYLFHFRISLVLFLYNLRHLLHN